MVLTRLRAGVAAALTVAAAIGVTVLAGGGIAPATAQPRAPEATLLAPPACTCSEPVVAAGHPLQNCTCGALQCVIAGSKPGTVAPALTCIR